MTSKIKIGDIVTVAQVFIEPYCYDYYKDFALMVGLEDWKVGRPPSHQDLVGTVLHIRNHPRMGGDGVRLAVIRCIKTNRPFIYDLGVCKKVTCNTFDDDLFTLD